MSTFSCIKFTKSEGVAFLTLNRPSKVNAFNVQMRDELSELLAVINDDIEVQGVIISGAGEYGFCGGADLTEFGTAPSMTIARYSKIARDIWKDLHFILKPTLVAIHGHCIGTGIEISALCDFRYATEDTVFRMPELHLGLMPAAGGTQSLTNLVNKANTLRMLYTGEAFSSNQAFEMGLIDGIFSDRGSMMIEVDKKMRQIIAFNSDVLRNLKKSVIHGADFPLYHALRLEQILAAQIDNSK